MKLYYWKKAPNFGDQLNAVLWPALLGNLLSQPDETLFVGIGTLLNSEIPPHVPKIIFGTGAGYGPPPTIDPSFDFICVRGPHTAAVLNLPPSTVVTDAALLARKLSWPPQKITAPVILIPHWQSCDFVDFPEVCQDAGIHFTDPRASAETVIGQIQAASLVLAESLHAAILADAFRIPWIPIALYEHIDRAKWQDWMQTHHLVYQPHEFPAPYKSYFSAPSNCAHYHRLSTGKLALPRKALFRAQLPLWKSQQKKIRRQLIAQLRQLANSNHTLLSTPAKSNALYEELNQRLEKLLTRLTPS